MCLTFWSLYTLLSLHTLLAPLYADDIELLFLEFKPSDIISIETTQSRLSVMYLWNKSLDDKKTKTKTNKQKNMLKLNDSKTEFFIAISPYSASCLWMSQLQIGAEIIKPSETLRLSFDSELSMSPQITSLCTNLTYHLRNIARIRRVLDRDSCHHLVRSSIFSPDQTVYFCSSPRHQSS